MHKTQYVIFDMDGLMFDTERLAMIAMQKVYAKYGYQLTEEIYLKLVGTNGVVSLNILHEHFGKDLPFEILEQETRDLMDIEIQQNGLPFKPGLETLLKYLKANNIPCAVASSTNHRYVEQYLTIAKLKDYFTFIIGGDEVTKTKPFPDIFLKALQKANVEASHALVLEDSENGILASCRAEIPVICIPDMKIHGKEINDLCLAVLPSLDKVIDYLPTY